jgi:hypothetical protein
VAQGIKMAIYKTTVTSEEEKKWLLLLFKLSVSEVKFLPFLISVTALPFSLELDSGKCVYCQVQFVQVML